MLTTPRCPQIIRKLLACSLATGLSIALSASVAHAHDAEPHAHEQPPPPAPTAGPTAPSGTLHFRILDQAGTLMPGRLTFMGKDGAGANLFPNAEAAPNTLAVRANIIYSKTGNGAVTVPAGRYTLYASRGLEWSIASQQIEVTPDAPVDFEARLTHELDTRGWISGDFHLHTLTHSGHGDANLKERVITFVGEGLEFAVATDHNHNTDYEPTLRELGLLESVTTVTGNEVSTGIGHFNAFPLDPARPIPPPNAYDANMLFKLIRAEPNRYNVTPVIQLNHPRWGDIDYFGRTGLDPVTGVASQRFYSSDFDTIEIFNENEGWGYYNADTERGVNTGQSKHSVLLDWFNLLNRGQRYAAVGNSDSHHVYAELAAYPRNFVRSPTDNPAQIDVGQVAKALRERAVFTTIGPFVELSVNDEPMGGQTRATNGAVELRLKIQAASWVDCDRVKVVVNGDVVDTLPVPDVRTPLRLETTHRLRTPRDCWIALQIEGDDPLDPIVHKQDRPIRPLAVLNPVWVDADGDGKWTAPWDQALARVQSKDADALSAAAFAALQPSERALTLLALAETKDARAAALVRASLSAAERVERISAARAAELLADLQLRDALDGAFANATHDPFMRVLILRTLKQAGAPDVLERVVAFVEGCEKHAVGRYGEDLSKLLGGDFVRQFSVVGYFPKPSADAVASTSYPPERLSNASEIFDGKDGTKVSWKTQDATRGGFLDLRQIDTRKEQYQSAIAYAQVFVFSPDARQAFYSLGTDDGCRFWVNDELLYEDLTSHGASPMQTLGRMNLRQGWNRALIKVENGGGEFGLFFRLFDQSLKISPQPAESPAAAPAQR